MKMKTNLKISAICLVLTMLVSVMLGCTTKPKVEAKEQTMKGYIIDYHCYDKKPDPALDSKACLQMTGCAASGYGIAVLKTDKTYDFYYFDGEFAPKAKDGQLTAINLVNNSTKKDHLYISVTGTLNGDTMKAADGKSYPIIKVTGMTEAME